MGELRPVFDDLGADKLVRDSGMSEGDVIETFSGFDAHLEGVASVKSLLRPKERKSLEEKGALADAHLMDPERMRFSADMTMGQRMMHASGDLPFPIHAQPRRNRELEDIDGNKDGSDDSSSGGSGSNSGTPKEEPKKRRGSVKENSAKPEKKGTPKEKRKVNAKSLTVSPKLERRGSKPEERRIEAMLKKSKDDEGGEKKKEKKGSKGSDTKNKERK